MLKESSRAPATHCNVCVSVNPEVLEVWDNFRKSWSPVNKGGAKGVAGGGIC